MVKKENKVGKVVRKYDQKHSCTDVTVTNKNGIRFSFSLYDDGKVLIYNHYDVTHFQFAYGVYEIQNKISTNPKTEGYSSPSIDVKSPL